MCPPAIERPIYSTTLTNHCFHYSEIQNFYAKQILKPPRLWRPVPIILICFFSFSSNRVLFHSSQFLFLYQFLSYLCILFNIHKKRFILISDGDLASVCAIQLHFQETIFLDLAIITHLFFFCSSHRVRSSFVLLPWIYVSFCLVQFPFVIVISLDK